MWVRNLEPRHRVLDGVSKASYYIRKRNKSSQMGTPKNDFKKTSFKADYFIFN
jgi:hypothetical protein